MYVRHGVKSILVFTSQSILTPLNFSIYSLFSVTFQFLISSPILLSFYPLCYVSDYSCLTILSDPSCSRLMLLLCTLFPHAPESCVNFDLMLSCHSPDFLALLSEPPVYKLCIFFHTTQSNYCIICISSVHCILFVLLL